MDTRKYCLDYKIISCSFNLTHDGKKKVYEKVSWSKITPENLSKYHDYKKNGFIIITGVKTKIIVIDCDINKAEGSFPQDILDTLDSCCKSIVKTPNGKHYYFSTDKSIKKQTGAYWKGSKVPCLDILADGSNIIAPPSHYTRGDTLVKYEWIEGGLDTLVVLPDEILEYIKQPTKNSGSVDIKIILDNLSVERYTDYTSWLNIGMILKSLGYSCDVWDDYSKRAPNYQIGVCYSKWRSFDDKSDLTVATLFKYLKEDNIEVFLSLKNLNNNLTNVIQNVTHANYAELFYINYADDYIYDKEKKLWFVLQKNNTWNIQTTVNLKIPIKTFITEIITRVRDSLDDSEDSESIKKVLYKAKMCIDTNGFVESIISWLKEYFTPDFTPFDKFDTNKNIIAFNNCLFDTTILTYRDILPTDYITITTGFDAPPIDYPVDDKLKKFFYSLFEDKDQEEYFLRILAYSLFGDRKHQELYLLMGKGGNGKSLVINLLLNALNNYCRNIPSTYITKPSDGKDGALPTLADAKDARILYTSEIESKDVLQVGFLKTIAGGDYITVRKLHSASFTFLPQFVLFILCNESRLSKVDCAIIRRLRVINFPKQFREVVVQENDRLIDKTLESYIKSESCILSLITLLLNTYIKDVHNKSSLNQSEQSKKDTLEYIKNNNPICGWLDENYNTNSDERITATDLLKHYNSENQKIRSNELFNYLDTLGFIAKDYNRKKCYNFKKKELLDE
jgi:P4 family phage/plasmid primase-like protien